MKPSIIREVDSIELQDTGSDEHELEEDSGLEVEVEV